MVGKCARKTSKKYRICCCQTSCLTDEQRRMSPTVRFSPPNNWAGRFPSVFLLDWFRCEKSIDDRCSWHSVRDDLSFCCAAIFMFQPIQTTLPSDNLARSCWRTRAYLLWAQQPRNGTPTLGYCPHRIPPAATRLSLGRAFIPLAWGPRLCYRSIRPRWRNRPNLSLPPQQFAGSRLTNCISPLDIQRA